MEIIEIVISIAVTIVGAVGGFYIKQMAARIGVEKMDKLTKYASMAVHAAKDTISGEGKGKDKFQIALGILEKYIGGNTDLIETAIKSAYQKMKQKEA